MLSLLDCDLPFSTGTGTQEDKRELKQETNTPKKEPQANTGV